jgi:hypothetical protein
MINNILKKLYRIKTSRKYLKIIKLLHFFFGEKFYKEIALPNFYDISVHRKEIINTIIKIKNFKNYLEIGCDQNELFSQVLIQNKIGVDPYNGGTHRMTSNIFFDQNNRMFDLIFIDGLHTYEQSLKDIQNSLTFLKENGFILVHDCFPRTYFDQAVPRAQRKWNGDVWKAILEIRTLEYVDTYVGAFDNGIGLILKRKNRNKLQLDSKVFKRIKYQEYYENYKRYLNLVNKDEFFKIIHEHK